MPDDVAFLVETLRRVADRVADEADYLTELDSEIGDADFGANLRRGLDGVREELTDREFDAPDEVLDAAGRRLISEMGGSTGILFGKSVMEGSEAVADGVDHEAAVEFVEACRDNVADQGDVDVGAKTMFDAIQPMAHVLRRGVELDDVGPVEASAQAVKACEYGAQFTIPLRARKGRASYTEWRSVGHPDPGAVGVLLVARVVHEVVQEVHGTEVEPHLPAGIDPPS